MVKIVVSSSSPLYSSCRRLSSTSARPLILLDAFSAFADRRPPSLVRHQGWTSSRHTRGGAEIKKITRTVRIPPFGSSIFILSPRRTESRKVHLFSPLRRITAASSTSNSILWNGASGSILRLSSRWMLHLLGGELRFLPFSQSSTTRRTKLPAHFAFVSNRFDSCHLPI